MKTSSHVSSTGPREERGMLPHPRPRLPVRGEIFPFTSLRGKKLPHPHPLMEEFPMGNWASGPHCHI